MDEMSSYGVRRSRSILWKERLNSNWQQFHRYQQN